MESKHLFSAEIDKLNHLSSVLLTIDYVKDRKTQLRLEHLLDDFNSIDFSLKICSEDLCGKIISHLCYLVPLNDNTLLDKFCKLIFNLLSRQQIILQTELDTITDYLVHCLYDDDTIVNNDVLRALGAVVYGNGGRISKFYGDFIGPHNVLKKIAFSDDELLRSAVQCIENICIRTPNCPYLPIEYQAECFQLFLKVLQMPKPLKMDEIGFCKTLISGLRGLQHILVSAKNSQTEFLGSLLAALKVYMLYGLPDCPATVSKCLYPMSLGQYDTTKNTATTPASKDNTAASAKGTADKNKQTGSSKPDDEKGGGKRNKKKKPGKGRNKDNKSQQSQTNDNTEDTSMSYSGNQEQPASPCKGPLNISEDPLANYPAWSKASSSESEWSDTEGQGYSRSRTTYTKVRQSALGCFYALVKATEKKVMFGYWSSFIPDTPGVGTPTKQHTIFTAIMKDPSARARTGALAVLTALVDGNKQYLMAAEDSAQYHTTTFTPFSVRLGYMIKEIHRCLLLCLSSEQSNLALTQIIKCLAALIPNVPYQRLRPGLLSRVIKQIKPFITHRDPNIRVVCLSCMGSMLSVQAPLLEVTYLLNPPKSSANRNLSESSTTQQQHQPPSLDTSINELEGLSINNNSESGYQSGGALGSNDGSFANSPLGIPTPNIPSGIQTPTSGDSFTFGNPTEMSWVIKLCVKNISPQLLEKYQLEVQDKLPSKVVAESAPARVPARTEQKFVQPLPVRLESLQVLASMCKGYFTFLGPHLMLIRDVLHCCLDDSDRSVQLHSAKLLDELGSVLSTKLQGNPEETTCVLKPEQVLEFWLPLLSGPIPKALQNVQNTGVRSTLCDCLSNIAGPVFEKLPMDKHILCITLILGLSTDDDRNVRASCVRALGVYVLYPCLREDVSFVADAANAIIQAMEQSSINVKVKATWSLGNLTDALVLNGESSSSVEDCPFTEEFSDMLLLKLFDVSVKGAGDNDKIRANAVRAVGNLLRYLPLRCYSSSKFSGQPITTAVKTLVKNSMSGIMKVRWNACYALGNLLKNPVIPFTENDWMKEVIEALKAAVRDCKNFKVRINAALALSIPKDRDIYGDHVQYSQIWSSLIQSLKTSEDSTDFSEFKYRDSLIQQVMSTLLHLACMLTIKDLASLSNIVIQEEESLEFYMDKYRPMLKGLPDKMLELQSTSQYLDTISCNELSQSQEKALNILQTIFTEIIEDSDGDRTPSPKPISFLQTYD